MGGVRKGRRGEGLLCAEESQCGGERGRMAKLMQVTVFLFSSLAIFSAFGLDNYRPVLPFL